jgi:hypothetical protein
MLTNEYALKFAREKYQDALYYGTATPDEIVKLKAEYDKQQRIADAQMARRVAR